jgi:DtxR family transcriptional regulator, Mn-dependent transcriptional regulator
VLLDESKPGKAYVISSVYERDRKLLEFLEERRMRPGTTLSIKQRNYDQTLTLLTERGTFSIGCDVAGRVWAVPARAKK